MGVGIPLTGSGQTTATVATEQIGGAEYQYMKIVDGQTGSSQPAAVEATTPSSADAGLVTRPVGSTSFPQAVVVGTGGSSANMVGQVALQAGTTDNFQYMQSIAFSSGNVARSSVSTTVDTQLIAANANRKALIIANRSTAQTMGIGFSTAVLTTALANVDCYIPPSSYLSFGLQGGLPLYKGPIRGINLTSTTVAGSAGITEFT